jgi:ketosteroid isomerase-like protein
MEGIRRADVDSVMGVYWNSPQLLLFNNNGTVTRSWEQVRANRASSYPNLRDVRLDVRDVRVSMLGDAAALVTCLWTQTQTAGGASESATGRLSLVFQNIGGAWKAVHTHTSPDRPDPARVLPSERTPEETDAPAKPPARPPVNP